MFRSNVEESKNDCRLLGTCMTMSMTSNSSEKHAQEEEKQAYGAEQLDVIDSFPIAEKTVATDLAYGKCHRHQSHYGMVTWDPRLSPTCPVCDAENEIVLQSKAMIFLSEKLEETRRPPPVPSSKD